MGFETALIHFISRMDGAIRGDGIGPRGGGVDIVNHLKQIEDENRIEQLGYVRRGVDQDDAGCGVWVLIGVMQGELGQVSDEGAVNEQTGRQLEHKTFVALRLEALEKRDEVRRGRCSRLADDLQESPRRIRPH